jgi:Na+-driven multidrug efflux pump
LVQSTANRVILNTIVQYTKTGINILITFFSTRIVLDVLGFDDYGIYSLVSGIILMLSFITNALSVSTQRFLSFYRGLEDNAKLKTIFCNCLWVHILLGIVIYFVLELFGTLLLDNFLNISHERIEATKTIFHIISISVLISFISSPFSALLIAHENILYVSIVSIINSILNLLIDLIIRYSSNDNLIE